MSEDKELYQVGIGVTDITGPVAGIAFMGYADVDQLGSGLLTRLHARAFYFENEQKKTHSLIIHTDLMSVSVRLRQRIATTLETKFPFLKANEIVIHSQHTHSGPAGYHTSMLYYLTIFGFSEVHFNLLHDRIVEAAVKSMTDENKFRAKLFFSHEQLLKVGRNRSPEAFANNPATEIETYIKKYGENKNTQMGLLRIFDVDEKINRGLLSFFPIHTTSFVGENHLVSSDNKGFAEVLLEAKYPNLTAAFFQTEAGDVSPNMADVSFTPGRVRFQGEGVDYIDACERMGRAQANTAETVLRFGEEPGKNERILTNDIDSRLRYANYSDFIYEDEEGRTHKTCPATVGVSMFAGTEDGRGPRFVHEGWNSSVIESTWFNRISHRLTLYITNLPKNSFLSGVSEPFEESFIKHSKLRWKRNDNPPSTLEEVYGYLVNNLFNFFPKITEDTRQCQLPKPSAVETQVGDTTLVPFLLPVQLVKLGNLLLPALPFEITSMSGERLRETIQDSFSDDVEVEILSISNGYAQYLTTEQEFQMQHYEGSSTLFGKEQLKASQIMISELAKTMQTDSPKFITSERDAFLAAVTNTDSFELFDDGSTSFEFDLLLHHWSTKDEISPLPFSGRFFSPGTLRKDVDVANMKLDLHDVAQAKKVIAEFYCVFPSNSQKIVKSFCDVERQLKDGSFETFQVDNDWPVRFLHRKRYLSLEVCTCEWLPHNSFEFKKVPSGNYRLRNNGAFFKDGEVEFFSGFSSVFEVVNHGAQESIPRVNGIDNYLYYTRDGTLLVYSVIVLLILRKIFQCVFSN